MEQVVLLGRESWDALVAGAARIGAAELAQRQGELLPEDPINIQYTSGTTGFPKGATLSHRNILNNGYFIGEVCRYTEADRVCIPVPFYHCFGMVMGNLACTTHGACMVIPAPGFDPVLRRAPTTRSSARSAPSGESVRTCRSPSSTRRPKSRSSEARRASSPPRGTR